MAYFDSDGVQIYYEEHGSGEPVVLVHGFASRADHNWGITQWYTALAPHYRDVALDCRGHGKSSKPHDREAYGRDKMALDVIRLMDHLGFKRTLIMGDAMLTEDISTITNERARGFRQFAESAGNDLKALAACMGGRGGDLTAEQIAAKNIRVPVMIVIGTKDLLVGNPTLLRDAIPGSKLVMLEGRDHLNAPGDKHYKTAVLEFFKSAPA